MTRNFKLLPALLLAVSISAFGQLIDPATFHIGNGVTGTCPTGVGPSPCVGVSGGEVLGISGTNFDVFQESGNNFLMSDPLLLIVAVPEFNNTTGTTLTGTEITSATEFDPYNSGSGSPLLFNTGTSGAYNLTNTFDQGSMGPGQNVYDQLAGDAAASNASDSFTNFNQAYADAGLSGTPTSYELFVWAVHVDPTKFTGNSAVDFLGTLPTGTFILAFDEFTDKNGQNIVTTQNTNTGLITGPGPGPGPSISGTPAETPTVPEPNGIVLVGSALLAVCASLRKRLIRS